ncbi:amino acid/polyamine/organocation transporter, APC superfamily [Quadrisphaera granulorum]|uniref:Amino acid/polyamine/organocation transporter (APC superfamily) n=1 Tax=Quadrisphaera granulorum TaxID=317664 RepID=A0A315ZVA3_9ACTN|nr:amino acid permease [Quadrisphaera granulorum]PWJ49536.1 amino acid/polyamine/organocation transporter (APC superfamily) [Quadrisphaera granulorum]SZE98115.1 amino acid/polyamine/organocation transporter, APC superfamily [Quadrisphaera granulorum]
MSHERTPQSPGTTSTSIASGHLSEFGYSQVLERRTSRFASFAVAFAFVSIATGTFTTYGAVLNSSGPLGIWTWPLVVVGQLAVALVFGCLAARIPLTGCSYQWMSRLASPVLGWFTGWITFTFLVVVAVAVDYTIASTLLPALFGYSGTPAEAWAITAAVLVLQAALVAFSTRWTERVNNVAVTAELVGMILLVVLVLVVGAVRGQLSGEALFSKGGVPAEGYFSFGSMTEPGPWVLAFLLGAFTIVGFESAANLAEETEDPEVVVPRAMWQAVLASGVLGFLFLVAIAAATPDPIALATSATPVADVIQHVLGSYVGSALLVLVTLAVFACGLVITMTGVRLVWAMSRDERFPGHRALSTIDAATGTPRNATVLFLLVTQCVLAVFAVQTNALFSLFSAATLLPAVLYLAVVIMYAVKRRQLPPTAGFSLGRAETPVIVLALVWLVFELSIFRGPSFRDPWLYVLGMTALGALYLGWLLYRRGAGGLAMPSTTTVEEARQSSTAAGDAAPRA